MLRLALIVFAATLIRALILEWWDRYKERKLREPIPMKLRNGVHVPSGPVQRIERLLNWAFFFWLTYMAVLLAVLAWKRLTG